MKAAILNRIKDQCGGAMIWALLLISVGSLTLPPLMSLATSSVNASQMYEDKTNQAYAADTGVTDGLWEIRYGDLQELFTAPEYNQYDYEAEWTYGLSEQAHGHKVNGYDVDVSIENVWIPKDVLPLNPADAKAVVEDAKLVVTGDIPDASTYRITVDYYPDTGEDAGELIVKKLGVWLPVGFDYGGSNSLIDGCVEDDTVKYCDDSEPLIEPHLGGTVIVWSFSSTTTAITDLSDVDPLDYPVEASVTFTFSSEQDGLNPAAVAWIETSGVDGIELSWDVDTKIYEITSIAGEATAQAHAAKTEIRKLGSEINGDYRAIGNSLMIDNGGSIKIRDELLVDSGAHVDDIPANANVALAYLYWSGWVKDGIPPIFEEECHDKSDWNFGGDWSVGKKVFKGHHNSHQDDRYMTTKSGRVDLSGHDPEKVEITVYWDQWTEGAVDSDDCLVFLYDNDGEIKEDAIRVEIDDLCGPLDKSTVDPISIPSDFWSADFRMGFYLDGFEEKNEFCYIDDITVAYTNIGFGGPFEPDTSVVFQIDGEQVCFDEDGLPQQHSSEIIADKVQILENVDGDGDPHGFSYSCSKDVTALLQEYSAVGDVEKGNHPGNGTYTVGGVNADTGDEWSYAGWSLVVIYESLDTEGHQLYLYDDFIYSDMHTNMDFDNDGSPGGTITGFIIPDPIEGETNAAKLTCFVGEGDDHYDGDYLYFNAYGLSNAVSPISNVWNSKSSDLSVDVQDGVDIDTFNITWESKVLSPGNSSVKVDLNTGVDSWNLVYIILSVRSETTTGGALDYLLEF